MPVHVRCFFATTSAFYHSGVSLTERYPVFFHAGTEQIRELHLLKKNMPAQAFGLHMRKSFFNKKCELSSFFF